MADTVRPAPDAAELIAQAGEGGRQARRMLLRRLMDVVAMPSSRVASQERSIAGDLLIELLIESPPEDRALCARRLQDMTQAPKRVLRFLAIDVIEVARPVIDENRALDDADLAYIVQHGGTEHRIAVAHRRELGPSVASAIADSGDVLAMRALLDSTLSALSDHSVDVIVGASREDRELVSRLLNREELRPAHALVMFWWADAAERRQILSRFSTERVNMFEACADIFAMAAREGWQDPVVRKAMQVIERRQRNRSAVERSQFASLEAAVEAARVNGMSIELRDEISHLAGIKPMTGARILADGGGEGIAVLCKATGLKRPYLRALWRSIGRRTGTEEAPDPAYLNVRDAYESLAVAKAQTILRYWNWSLSSAFAPDMMTEEGDMLFDDAARPVGAARRSMHLVFGRD